MVQTGLFWLASFQIFDKLWTQRALDNTICHQISFFDSEINYFMLEKSCNDQLLYNLNVINQLELF